ncbi:AAA family ATPase [Streptomyces sp. NBC_01635]|uniref:AAA family ATPase n=1 Tax=Streptomyces hirsutus TaxID=35620 RepID=A0ABZ1H011_9ACTN|nr:AAA family ATPase [Streptomyces hirsutus]WSD10403.1 AAA family ATPase [Streptomyces hirsutus]WTD78978.1 AAA family ATPase [Streptomyces sp. NBC_01635]
MTAAHGSSPRDRRPEGPGPELVERERELALIARLLRSTAAGEPALVVFEGPDGIGKTTLMNALMTQARELRLRVVHTRAGQTGHRLPLSTTHALLAGLSTDGSAGLPLTAWPSPPGGATARPQGLLRYDVGATSVSFSVLAELHEVVRRAAMAGPLVIAVDDVEEADPASLRFLAHTARRMTGLPVLLALARSSGAHVASLNEVAALPLCHVLRPRPLTGAGIGLLTRRLVGTGADSAFQESALAATNGNPLMVTRLLTALREEELPLTATHFTSMDEDDVLAFRPRALRLLHRQPRTTVQAARALAVLGDGAAPETSARLAHLDSTAFVGSVLVLSSIGFVTSNGDGTWSFAHALLRKAVLGDMSGEELASAHRRAARLLHDSGASAADVAEHLRRAATAPEPWARTVLREAARDAMLRSSPDRAVELLRPCVPEGSEDTCDLALLVELGVAETRVDPAASVRHLTAALKRASRPGLRLTAFGALTEALTRRGQVAHAVALLARYRSDVTAPSSGVASPHLLEAQMLLAASANRAAYTELLETVTFDVSLPGETAEERALLAARAVISVCRLDRVAESVAAARTVADRASSTTDAMPFRCAAGLALLYADLPHEAERVYRQLLEDTDPLTDRIHPSLLAFSAMAHQRLGGLDEALRATAAVLRDVDVPRATVHQALPLAVRLHTLLDRGDVAEASLLEAQIPDPVQDEAWQWNEVLCARGRLHLAKDDPKRALAHLEECERREAQWRRVSPAVSPWWYWAGRAHLALGDRRAARALAEEAVGHARAAHLPCALGSGLGLWAETVDDDERLPLLEEAEQVLADTGAALLRARVRVARGQMLHRLGYNKAAREVLRQGWEEAYTVGSRSLHRVAHRALLATGARPRRPVSRGLGALTHSEAQVARLAADGRSNAWIAERLFVTQRTVEVHLTSVYRKLGLSGRRELRDALESADAGTAAHGT